MDVKTLNDRITRTLLLIGSLLCLTGYAQAKDLSATHANKLIGAVNGDFSVSEGELSYSVPFGLPAGPHNLSPTLGIEYSQSSGNGVLGVGFVLGGMETITRCSANKEVDGFAGGVNFDSNDRYCLNGSRLISVSGAEGAINNEYRLLSDNFTKVVSNGGSANNPSSWTVYYPSGYISTFGASENSRDRLNGNLVGWRLAERKNRFDQSISYEYSTAESIKYLEKISYSGFEITFNYGGNAGEWVGYNQGVEQRLTKKLNSIEVWNLRSGQNLIKEYKFSYTATGNSQTSRMNSVSLCDANNQCTPGLGFKWDWVLGNELLGAPQVHILEIDEPQVYINGDLDNDGRVDICYYDEALYCSLQGSEGFGNVYKASDALDKPATDLPANNDTLRTLGVEDWSKPEKLSTFTVLDINNDGFNDYCALGDIGVFCGLNNGQGQFDDESYWNQTLTIEDGLRFTDINQDRLTDLCVFSEAGLECHKNSGTGFNGEVHTYSGDSFTWPLEKEIEYRTTLTYPGPVPREETVQVSDSTKWPQPQMMDINGDGYTDICGVDTDGKYRCSIGSNNTELTLGQKQEWNLELEFGPHKEVNDQGTRECGFACVPEVEANIVREDYQEQVEEDLVVTDEATRPFRYADLNADGLVDVCYRVDASYMCQINDGTKFLPATVWMTLDDAQWEESDWRGAYESNIRIEDFNYDQLPDFCAVIANELNCNHNTGQEFSGNEWTNDFAFKEKLFVDVEEKRQEARGYTKPAKKLFGLRTKFTWTAASTVFGPFKMVGDVTGDGMPDMCYRSTTGITCVEYKRAPLARLISVTNSFGAKMSVEYDVAANVSVQAPSAPQDGWVDLVPNQLVVSSLTNESGPSQGRIDYQYGPYRRHLSLGTGGYTQLVKHNRLNNKTTEAEYSFTDTGQRLLSKTTTKVNGIVVAKSTNDYEQAPRDDERSIVHRLIYSLNEGCSGQVI